MKNLIVNSCEKCIFLKKEYDDWVVGQTITNECKLTQFFGEKDNIISINEIITPEWCPLKKEEITIKFEDLSKTKDDMTIFQKTIEELQEQVLMLSSTGDQLEQMYKDLENMCKNEGDELLTTKWTCDRCKKSFTNPFDQVYCEDGFDIEEGKNCNGKNFKK